MTSTVMIAIDGPAASGKSTIALHVARRLDYLFFDTGVMYRAATLAALRRGASIEDEDAVTAIASEIIIDVQPPTVNDGRAYSVFLDDEDVTWEIRTPEVDANVSEVSMYKGVREAMTAQQREIGLRGRVVMVGRDIGTVVLPEADLKIYLDASVEERAMRRYKESQERGEDLTYEEILQSMRNRDRLDSTREHAPLMAAEEAVVIDTTELTIDEVVDRILKLASDGIAGL
ncbi:MAG: (d)CMP kinase [Anaerolineales bacterium]|nr:(d)CMP kinase [Anaerolineales bacterium]